MKKIFLILLILVVPFGLFAQTNFDYASQFENVFKDFSGSVAKALPLNSTIGLNWSDAYIGQLFEMPPHFGVGLTVGVSTIPYTAIVEVLDTFGIRGDLESESGFQYIQQFGLPFPAYAFDARIGGFIFPFDLGLKFGFIPRDFDLNYIMPNLLLDYTLIGFDIRIPLVEEEGILPDISIGGGYNYLKGLVGLKGIFGEDITIQSFDVPGYGTTDITLSDPAVTFNWESSVIDLKIQISKSLLIFTPYLGIGSSVSFSRAGGGLESEVTSPSEAEIDQINQALAAAGMDTLPELTDQGFYVSSQSPAQWNIRAFGGFSLDLLIIHLDLGAAYDFIGRNYAATVGLRVQL